MAQGSKGNTNSFEGLIEDLKSRLGTDAGLDSAHIDPKDLQHLMELYVSKENEWSKYAWSDLSRGYTRNLVDRGNGKSNLLILVWTPGKGSPIHDHANAHCLMKVLKGTLIETRYNWPSLEKGSSPLSITQQTIFGANQVTYMSDKLGLHRISNPDNENIAVSLHLYTPPNAAKYGCNIFDATTGQSSHIQQCNYYSEFGVKL